MLIKSTAMSSLERILHILFVFKFYEGITARLAFVVGDKTNILQRTEILEHLANTLLRRFIIELSDKESFERVASRLFVFVRIPCNNVTGRGVRFVDDGDGEEQMCTRIPRRLRNGAHKREIDGVDTTTTSEIFS